MFYGFASGISVRFKMVLVMFYNLYSVNMLRVWFKPVKRYISWPFEFCSGFVELELLNVN